MASNTLDYRHYTIIRSLPLMPNARSSPRVIGSEAVGETALIAGDFGLSKQLQAAAGHCVVFHGDVMVCVCVRERPRQGCC